MLTDPLAASSTAVGGRPFIVSRSQSWRGHGALPSAAATRGAGSRRSKGCERRDHDALRETLKSGDLVADEGVAPAGCRSAW